MPFSQPSGQLLFHLISKLYENTLLLITTNLAFADWPQVFGDAKMTNAMLGSRTTATSSRPATTAGASRTAPNIPPTTRRPPRPGRYWTRKGVGVRRDLTAAAWKQARKCV